MPTYDELVMITFKHEFRKFSNPAPLALNIQNVGYLAMNKPQEKSDSWHSEIFKVAKALAE